MDEQDWAEAKQILDEDPERNAVEHHRGASQNEDGDHWLDADWRRCPGCQADNPYYEEAMRGWGQA